ncbi:MAG TPA: VOC family protein [Jatrophihabitans sp.]|nr:VOC family protein [Jatrophihabitans sp.]
MAAVEFPAGAPCWIELTTNHADRSREFYPALFGWTAEEPSPEFGGYFMFFKDGVPIAGGMPVPDGMALPDSWNVYLNVEDARKTLEVATAHRASITVEAMDVADLGTSAVIDDPSGARIGLWQPNTFAGFGVLGQPGAPAWFELLSLDYDTAVPFYREVFGWDAQTMADSPQFRYTTLGRDDGARAGIMDAAGMRDERGAGEWSVYFAADDTDAVLARVRELGGAVVRPAEDTPYGRLAVATDPTGALLKLMGPNKG